MPTAKRYIEIPAPIQLLHPRTDEPMSDPPVTFNDFFRDTGANPIWISNMHCISAYNAIRTALQTANGILELEEPDWEIFRRVIETPQYQIPQMGPHASPGYPSWGPVFALQLVKFMNAVIFAKNEPPAEYKPN